jgi:hypothetical protein
MSEHELNLEDQDVEAQGLKETMAIALGVGALAAPTAAMAYPQPEPGGPADRPAAVVKQASTAKRGSTAAKTRKAKKQAKHKKSQAQPIVVQTKGNVLELPGSQRPAGRQPQ